MSDVPIRDADDMTERPYCELCGDPMPAGEEMFKFHGYSGPCPTLKSGQQTRPKSSWELRCEQAERERDEAVALLRELVGVVELHTGDKVPMSAQTAVAEAKAMYGTVLQAELERDAEAENARLAQDRARAEMRERIARLMREAKR